MLTVKRGRKDSVAFPGDILEELGLSDGEKVGVRLTKNAVVITKEADGFLALEGALKDADIESPVRELRRAWKRWKAPKSL